VKIAIISNSPNRGTGFGQQTQLLAQGFHDRGHEVVVVCEPYGVAENAFPWEEIRTEAYDAAGIDRVLSEIRPNVAIFFDSAQRINGWMDLKVAPANIPIYYWFPYEGSTVPEDMLNLWWGVAPGAVIHLSYFSQKLWTRAESDRVIHHAVNPAFRKLDVSKSSLRKKWSKLWRVPIFPDAPLVLNINRNFWHKGWDLAFDYVARMKETIPEIQFLAHTKADVEETRGGFNLRKMAKVYGIEDNVVFSGFDWNKHLPVEDLNEIINMSDWRIDTSHGEGWGLTVAECMAAGLPQLLTDHTTMSEIVGEDYPGLIPPATTRYSVGTTWKVPDIKRFVEASATIASVKYDDSRLERFSVSQLIDSWEEVFEQDLGIDFWGKHRYGYRRQHTLRGSKQSVARIASLTQASVFELGSYDGETIDWAVQFGVSIVGQSDKPTSSEKKDAYVKVKDIFDPWPPADMLVFTDEQDSFAHAEPHIFNRFSDYKWIVARLQDRFIWGQDRFPAEQMRAVFARSHKRRTDLELIVKNKLPFFDYEIWTIGEDTPEALLKM
jgi:glycosyltransferase involved in cell wall biosynthesis